MISSKDKLMEAILEEVRQNGYKNASTKKIAQRAQMNESSIFRLYGTKKQLFLDAIYCKSVNGEIIDMDMIRVLPNFEERVETLLTDCLRFCFKQMVIHRIFMLSIMDDVDIEHSENLRSRMQQIIEKFLLFFKEENSNGIIYESDYSTLAELIFSQMLIVSLNITAQAIDESDVEPQIKSFVKRYSNYLSKKLLKNQPAT